MSVPAAGLLPPLLGSAILPAMLWLFVLLALASTSAGLWTAAKHPVRQQINAWWLLFPLVCLSLAFYRVGPLLLTLLIALLAQRELLLHYRGPPWRFRSLCFGLIALQVVLAVSGNPSASSVLLIFLLVQSLRFSRHGQSDELLLLLFIVMCFGLSFVSRLFDLPQPPEVKLAWCFYLFVVTALNDIAQFVSGKCFGKHRVASRLSPNKTWQGLIGGVLVSLLVSVTLGRYLQLADVGTLFALALLLALGGFAGDLLFSGAKRRLGIKDFSQLIPGHGGILDRVDSLVLTAPLLYAALTW